MTEIMKQIIMARDYIRERTAVEPDLAVILGSGLGGLVEEIQIDTEIPYTEIPGFPRTSVPGHAGRLITGTLQGKKVIVMQGRFHYYEGHPMVSVIFPVRVMRFLGAEKLIVTNAAGGLNPTFNIGDVMLITDQINTMGTNPLIGPNEDEIGTRFPDVTHSYDPELRALAVQISEQLSLPLQQGVYAAVSGPSYETPAERRYLRIIGGDAVGMSTVPEVIAAKHAGMRVLGFSAITNIATGGADQKPDDHMEVLANAKIAGEKLVVLVRSIIEAMP